METTYEGATHEDMLTTYSVEPMTSVQMRARHDQLILEAKLQAEQGFVEQLRAQGKPVYKPQEVADRFGIPVDPTWTQSDLQHYMAVGDVVYPIQGLARKAADIHRHYVVKGRDGIKTIMGDVYASFLKAEMSEHKELIYGELRGRLLHLGRKVKKETANAAVMIRCVFADFDDKQVHVHSKALEVAYFKNVAAKDFIRFVELNGGWEGLRQLAMKELPKTAKQLEEAEARAEAKKHREQTLNDWWDLKRASPSFKIDVGGEADSFEDGKEVVLRAYVKNGQLCVYWWCPDEKPLVDALNDNALRRCDYEAKHCHFSGVDDGLSYMAWHVEWERNPPPAIADRREAAADRARASEQSQPG